MQVSSTSAQPKVKRNTFLNVTFIRHADSTLNTCPRTVQGQNDAPLSNIGVKQAKALAWRLRNRSYDEIYTSDLTKCKQTVLEILKVAQPGEKTDEELLSKVTIDFRLRERAAGTLTGKNWSDIKPILSSTQTAYESHLLANGGEAFESFQDRVLEFYANVIDKHLLDPSGMSLESLIRRDDDPITPMSALIVETNHLSIQTSCYKQLHSVTTPKSPLELKALSVLPSPGGIYSIPENRLAVSFGSVTQASVVPTNAMESSKRASSLFTTITLNPPPVTNGPLAPLTIPTTPATPSDASPLPPTPQKPRNILIITHGGPIELLFSHFLNELGCGVKCELQTGFPKAASIYRLQIDRMVQPGKDWMWVGNVVTMNDVAHHALLKNDAWHQWRLPGQTKRQQRQKMSVTAAWLSSMEDEKPVYVSDTPNFVRTNSMPSTPYPREIPSEETEVDKSGNPIKRVFKRLSDKWKKSDNNLPPLPQTVEEPPVTRKKSLGW